MNPAVSVIYVNYNTSALLLQSVKSLIARCRGLAFEIIIIDNASREDEKEKLQKGLTDLKESVKLIFSDHNLGFGKANNLGVKQSSGSYLFFLNPDTLILNDVLTIFYSFLSSAPSHIAACGGNLLKPDLSPNDSFGNFPGVRQELAMTGLGFRFFLKDYRLNIAIASTVQGKEPRIVPYIVGADIFIRKESFNLAEGFDECYFLYYEETDLFKKLDSMKLLSFILPDAHIIHLEGAALVSKSNEGFSLNKFEYLLNSKMHYYRKWFPSSKIPIIKFIMLVQICAQFIKGNMGARLKPLLKVYFKLN